MWGIILERMKSYISRSYILSLITKPVNVSTDVSPVNQKRPDDCCQQNLVSFEGDGAPVKEERKVRADDDGEALSEVPVPGMRAVEISHTVDDVKLEEVELDHGPLKHRETMLFLTLRAVMWYTWI